MAATITHLSRWPDPAPIEALFAMMESGAPAEIRGRACSAVIQLTTTAADRGQRPDDVLAAWFGRASAAVDSVEQKRQLISGLARVRTVDSLRLLEPYLKDPEVTTEALYALLAIGPPVIKAGHSAVVQNALPDVPAIEDDDLRWRVGKLKEEVDAADLTR